MIFFRSATGNGKFGFLIFFVLLLFRAPTAFSQSGTSPDTGNSRKFDQEWEIWSGVGGEPYGIRGVNYGNGVWNAGFRYGWILTGPHGRGPLRGRFEYAVDALPAVLVFQPGGNAYGFGFNPCDLKWNLEPRRRISPYLELGVGALISTKQIPVGASRFNFTPTGAIGVTLLRGRYRWNIDFRYFHISDAQLTAFNPGTDTFGFRIGFGALARSK